MHLSLIIFPLCFSIRSSVSWESAYTLRQVTHPQVIFSELWGMRIFIVLLYGLNQNRLVQFLKRRLQ